MDIQTLRANDPDLAGLNDDQVIDVLHQAYYPDIPREQIASRLGVKPPDPAKQPRSWGQAASDTFYGLEKGGAGLVKGVGTMYGLVTGNMDNPVAKLGQEGEEYWDEQKSPQLKAKQAALDSNVASKDGLVSKYGSMVKGILSDPALLSNSLAENAYQLLPVAGMGRLAYGARMAAAGAEGAEAAAPAAAAWGTAAAKGTSAVQLAADVADRTYQEAMNKPDEVWQQNPEFIRRVSQGENPDDVKHDLALSAARVAFPVSTAITYAATSLPGGDTIQRTLVGGAAKPVAEEGMKGLAKASARAALGEAVAETLFEGGSAVAGNMAIQHYVDPNQPTGKYASEAAGAGAIVGGVMGAATGPFHAHAEPTQQQRVPEVGPMSRAVNLALPAPTVTVDPAGNAMTADQRNAAIQARMAGNVLDVTPVPQAPPGNALYAGQSAPALPAPTINVNQAGVATTADQRNQALQTQPEPGPRNVTPVPPGPLERAAQVAPPALPGPNMAAPGGAMIAGQDGVRPQTYADQTAARAAQQQIVDTGLTPDVRQAQAMRGDLTAPSGKPFKTMVAATLAQNKVGGKVVPVDDGFVVRPEAQDVSTPVPARAGVDGSGAQSSPDNQGSVANPVPTSDQRSGPGAVAGPAVGSGGETVAAQPGQRANAEPLGPPDQIWNGRGGAGMTVYAARAQMRDMKRQFPDLKWTVAPAPEFGEDKYRLEGRKPQAETNAEPGANTPNLIESGGGQTTGSAPAARSADARKAAGKQVMQVKPETDTMLQALAKMGGIRRDVVSKEFGLKPEELKATVQLDNRLKAYPFRATGGMDMDQAITALQEHDFLHGLDPANVRNAFEAHIYNELGGHPHYTALGDMQRGRAMADEQAQEHQDELEKENEAEARAERSAIMAEADVSEHDLSAVEDDDLAELQSNASTEQAMRALGFSEEEIQDAVRKEASSRPAQGSAAEDAQSPPGQAPPAGRARTEEARRGNAGSVERKESLLSTQTEADLKAKAQRESDATKAEAARKAAEQERLRKADEAKDNKTRADQTVDDFQLGQSAKQQLSGMGDLFSQEDKSVGAGARPGPRERAVDVVRWWRQSHPNAKPEDFTSSLHNGTTVNVGPAGSLKHGEVEVDGIPSQRFKIKDLWNEPVPGTPKPSVIANQPSNAPITDVGEKIGGARKDTSFKTGSKGTKKASEAPGWRKRYEVAQIVKNHRPEEEGRWAIRDSRSKDYKGQSKQVGRSTYATKEEAEQAIPLAEVARNHSVYAATNGDGKQVYRIYRNVSERKRVQVVDKDFDTRDQAMEYMARHPEQIIETKTSFGEEILPRPDTVVREGVAHRTGNVKGEDFLKDFGLRGVEFGNWNSQDERQTVMNHAYDALSDMAQILGIPARAIGLNGELGLAFGARGHGLSGARAHFEPTYVAINLTKMNGAGSLGHEWFHALDNYFARQDGKAPQKRTTNREGNQVFPDVGNDRAMASHGFSHAVSGVREELRDAYKALIQTMMKKAETYVEDTQKVERFLGDAKQDVANRLQSIRNELATEHTYKKRNNKPATADQLADFDAIAEKIIAGEMLDTELRDVKGAKSGRNLGLSGYRWTNDSLEQLSTIFKAVRGSSGFDATNKDGALDRLRSYMSRYSERLRLLAQAQNGTEKTKLVPTSFVMEAKSIDQGRASDYWATPHEMAARAFQAYLEDKAKESGARNDFLTYGTHTVVPTPWGWKRPFPQGEERAAINAAFDKFVSQLKTKETDKGVALFSRKAPYQQAMREALQAGASNRDHVQIERTPAVLKMLGVDDKPVYTSAQVLRKMHFDHGLTDADLSALPKLLAKPVMVFKSDTQSGRRLVVTNLIKDGKPLVLAVEPNGFADRTPAVYVTSAYFKDDPSAFGRWTRQGLLEYADKSQSRQLVTTTGHQLPGVVQRAVGFRPPQYKTETDLAQMGNEPLAARTAKTEPFYSALSQEVDGLNMKAAPAVGWKQALMGLVKSGKIKQDEIEWSGIKDWLDMQQGKVSKESVQQYLDQNGVRVEETRLSDSNARELPRGWSVDENGDGTFSVLDDRGNEMGVGDSREEAISNAQDEDNYADTPGATKYGHYTLPGGKNYTELLLTLPRKVIAPNAEQNARVAEGRKAVFDHYAPLISDIDKRIDAARDAGQRGEYDRLFEQRARLIDERDGVAARKAGVISEPKVEPVKFKSSHWNEPNVLAHVRFNEHTDSDGKRVLFIEELQSDWAQAARKGGDVASGPFVGKTDAWVSLAIKRMIKYAVDHGFDRVAFINGEQSSERNDLSKNIESVEYRQRVVGPKTGTGLLTAYDHSGNQVLYKPDVKPKDIPDYIGKEAAERLMADDNRGPGYHDSDDIAHVLSGESLKVGGEGMRAFYDKIVPSIAKDVVRKLGGGGLTKSKIQFKDGTEKFTSEQNALDITPKMRELDSASLPLFKSEPRAGRVNAAPLSKEIGAIAKKWKAGPDGGVHVVQSVDDLPESILKAVKSAGAEGEAKALFMPKSKAVYLIADNLDSADDAKFALFHEVYGHAGLRAFLGDAYASEMSRLRVANPALAREADAWFKQYGHGDIQARIDSGMAPAEAARDVRLLAIEEALADRAGNNEPLKGWQHVAAKIQAFLRKIGMDSVADWMEGKTQAETLQLLANARKAIQEGPADQPHVFTGAEALASRDTPAFSRVGDAIKEKLNETHVRESTLGEMTPEQLEAAKNVMGDLVAPSIKDRWDALKKDFGLRAKQALVDQFAPIANYSQKAYMQARLSKGADGTLEATLMYGKPVMRDGAPDVDVKDTGFAKVLSGLKGEQDRFFLWVAAQRAERLKEMGLENLFTEKDISALKTLNVGKMADGTSRQPVFAQTLRSLNEFNDAVLKVAEESGLIDPEARKLFKDAPYVPFYRMMDDDMTGPRFSSGLVNQSAWKKLKGGTQQLNHDLLANVLLNWSHLYQASAKNRAAFATIKAAEEMGIAHEVDAGTKGSVKIMQGGEARHYVIDDPHLLEAVSALNYTTPEWVKPLSKVKRMLTLGVTANPAFKIRNLIRDSISAIAQSDLDPNALKNIAQGWKSTRHDSQTYASMMASGGLMRFGTYIEGSRADRAHELVHKLEGEIMDRKSAGELWHKVQDTWEAYQEFGDRSEQINRTALYEQLRAKGYDHAEASFMARDLMDFSLSGAAPIVRFLVQTVPFLNARLQGLYKLGRAAKEDPKRFAAISMAVSLASLGLLAAYHDDKDWQKREDWDRDTYWWFKIGDKAFRIPKPFEVGSIGTIAERTAELMFDPEMTNKRYMDRLKNMVFNTFSMDPTPQIIKPFLDVYANKDSFSGRPIEGAGLQNLKPEDRYDQHTSMVARFLGQLGLPNPVELLKGNSSSMSPKQIDFLFRAYLGWIGTSMLTAADYGLRPMADVGAAPAMQLKDVFLAGNFVESLPTNSSRFVTAMYDQAQDVDQAWASYHAAIKSGDMERAKEIQESDMDNLRQYHKVEALKRRESEINAAIKRVEASRTLDADAKRTLIDGYEQTRDRIAEAMRPAAARSQSAQPAANQ